MKISAKRIINGSFGSISINGIHFADVEEVKLDIDIDRTDVNQGGSLGTDSKILSTKGTGSIKFKKVYSREVALLLPIIKSGKDIRAIIVCDLKDPDSYGYETVQVSEVWFNNLPVADFKVKELSTRELKIGFNPDNVEYLDIIEK